jgi:hypothetical protein
VIRLFESLWRRKPIVEAATGDPVPTGEFGLLNEDEMLIMKAVQCSFFYQPPDD